MQDSVLKRIFSGLEMIALLVRRHRPELASSLDFSTLTELSNELVSDQLVGRFPDKLFIADRRGRRGKVLLHLEFQATVDPDMTARILAYVGLALQKLRKQSPDLRRPGALVVVSMKAPVDVEGLRPGLIEPCWSSLGPLNSTTCGRSTSRRSYWDCLCRNRKTPLCAAGSTRSPSLWTEAPTRGSAKASSRTCGTCYVPSTTTPC